MPFNGFTVYGKTSVTGSYGGTAEPASSVKISGVSSRKNRNKRRGANGEYGKRAFFCR